MIVLSWWDYFVLQAGTLRMRKRTWSPIGDRVLLEIKASRDPSLIGHILSGVIEATSPDADVLAAKAVIRLDGTLNYCGHYRREGIAVVRAAPERRWHGLNRLLVAPALVRVIDCDVAEDGKARALGVAVLALDRRVS